MQTFKELTCKQFFPFCNLDDPQALEQGLDLDIEWLKAQGCTHAVRVSYNKAYDNNYPMSDWRGAVVKKTVAYVAVDEGDRGQAIFDKWDVKQIN